MGNEVYFVSELGWEKATLIDFNHNSFDLIASEVVLQPGYTISGHMAYEVLPEMRGKQFKIEKLEITIEDISGDSQVFLLDPAENNSEGFLLNSVSLYLPGIQKDLTQEKYYKSSLYDLHQSLFKKPQ